MGIASKALKTLGFFHGMVLRRELNGLIWGLLPANPRQHWVCCHHHFFRQGDFVLLKRKLGKGRRLKDAPMRRLEGGFG